jgi:glycosyltransferase involved in cell wall biosynthesis
VLDVVVQPNRGPEGLGRSMLEAMSAGVPVIAVDRWGPAEIVADGDTGLLTPWMDVEALSERMLRLARDHTLRRRLATNAEAWLTARIDPQAIAGEFRAIMNGVA